MARARLVPDQAFALRDGFYAIVDGKLVRATFNSIGAARASIPVEQRRRLKRRSGGK